MRLIGPRALAPGTSTVVAAAPEDLANEAAVAGRKPAVRGRAEAGCMVVAVQEHM